MAEQSAGASDQFFEGAAAQSEALHLRDRSDGCPALAFAQYCQLAEVVVRPVFPHNYKPPIDESVGLV